MNENFILRALIQIFGVGIAVFFLLAIFLWGILNIYLELKKDIIEENEKLKKEREKKWIGMLGQ